MAPKKKFTKQQIIDAAFEIAKADGLDSVSIRKVADKLGSSIAPIYVNFKEVEELKREVFRKINELSYQFMAEENSGSPFQDIGAASLRFAREYSVLFKDLVMKQNDYVQEYDQNLGQELVGLMKTDTELEGFTEEELANILLKMRIFTTGLSIMVASRALPPAFGEELGLELMNSMAQDVIQSARARKEGN